MKTIKIGDRVRIVTRTLQGRLIARTNASTVDNRHRVLVEWDSDGGLTRTSAWDPECLRPAESSVDDDPTDITIGRLRFRRISRAEWEKVEPSVRAIGEALGRDPDHPWIETVDEKGAPR